MCREKNLNKPNFPWGSSSTGLTKRYFKLAISNMLKKIKAVTSKEWKENMKTMSHSDNINKKENRNFKEKPNSWIESAVIEMKNLLLRDSMAILIGW
jgi:hypothetical protein